MLNFLNFNTLDFVEVEVGRHRSLEVEVVDRIEEVAHRIDLEVVEEHLHKLEEVVLLDNLADLLDILVTIRIVVVVERHRIPFVAIHKRVVHIVPAGMVIVIPLHSFMALHHKQLSLLQQLVRRQLPIHNQKYLHSHLHVLQQLFR